MLGPLKVMHPGEGALRKMICIRRRFEDVVIEPEWENWERLSYRRLRRKCTPARVSLMVFAKPRIEYSARPENPSHLNPDDSEAMTRESQKRLPSAADAESEPPAKRRTVDEENQERSVREDPKSSIREMIDLASQKHGPRFLELKTEDQQWLLKLHKNLGHPGSMKLQTFCKHMNCQPYILEAIPDMKCSTCTECKSQNIPRPSVIHEERDFGDVVSMDGVTWTNKNGKIFHFYHFIDHSTAFQTAVCSPSRTTDSALRALTVGWISWGGPPGLLCLDSAGEFCNEEFLNFMQKHNIRVRMIPPEASWQNSRAERHGGILQEMLSRMDQEENIDDYDKLEQNLAICTQTKNCWSRHRGYLPEMLVFGKLRKFPGSVSSDSETSAHLQATEETPEGIRFRKELEIREKARKAFAQVDNSQTLRRALVQRSRPARSRYYPGEWIMIWRKDGRWMGPFKTIIQEGANTIWASRGHQLFRASPEQVRHLSAFEEHQYQHEKQEMTLSGKDTSQISRNFQDLRLPESDGIPTELPPMESRRENIPNTPESNTSEQPDNEPEIRSRSENSEVQNPEMPESLNPEDIPVPSDDELLCEAFSLETEQCWEISFNLTDQEIGQLAGAGSAKRQKVEVKMSNLSPADRARFDSAKEKEINSWLETQTVAKIARHRIPPENILKCRWVLTWKNSETNEHLSNTSSNQNRTPKARLVVLGFMDPKLHEIQRDSPTLTKLGRSLILQLAAANSWRISSFDVKTAFLRGTADQERVLGLEPVPEFQSKLQMRQGEVLQLLKGAYGRADAPLLWFREIRKGLLDLNFEQCPIDPCVFTLTDPTGKTCGAIGLHVDDGIFGGNHIFEAKLSELSKKYPFGSRKHTDFVFTGIHVSQGSDMTISLDQSQYVKEIEPIKLLLVL